jgi:excisionase family DNA binding protein
MARNDVEAAVEKALGAPLLLTFAQTGELLNQSRSSIYALVRSGKLPVVHLGRSARIPRVAVEAFVAELVAEARGECHRPA